MTISILLSSPTQIYKYDAIIVAVDVSIVKSATYNYVTTLFRRKNKRMSPAKESLKVQVNIVGKSAVVVTSTIRHTKIVRDSAGDTGASIKFFKCCKVGTVQNIVE